MARTRVLAIVTIAGLVIGGCGSSPVASAPESAATQQPSVPASMSISPSQPLAPTPAPTASLTADLPALAARYQVIGVKTTAARARCKIDANAAAADLASAKAAARRCLDDFSQVVADFKAAGWGPAQPQADAVIAAIDVLDGLAATMADAATVPAFRVAYDKLPAAENALLVAAARLRAALGLPPD